MKRERQPCARCGGTPDYKSRYCGSCKILRKDELRKLATVRQRRRYTEIPGERERQVKASAEYRRKYPERAKASELRSRLRTQPHLRMYGISPDQVLALIAAQNGRCAICRRVKKLGVDHNHMTGRIRGMLCGSCNRGIGLFGDSIERLLSAIRYLSPFREDLEPLALFQEPTCIENYGLDGEIESIDFCGGTISAS